MKRLCMTRWLRDNGGVAINIIFVYCRPTHPQPQNVYAGEITDKGILLCIVRRRCMVIESNEMSMSSQIQVDSSIKRGR